MAVLQTVGMSTVGCKLYVGNATKASATAIAEVFNISGPSLSQTAVDTTHHNSTSRFRTYVPGFSDAGEVTADIRYIPTTATHDNTVLTGLFGLIGATDVSNWHVEWNDHGTASTSSVHFAGILTSFTPSADLDSSLDASLTIKASGVPTLTQGANS